MRSIILSLIIATFGSAVHAEDEPNPFTADPSTFELAFLLPQNMGIEKGTVTLTIVGTQVSTGTVNSQDYIMKRSGKLIGPTDGLKRQENGAHYQIYQFSNDDLARINTQQATVVAWHEIDKKDTKGEVDIDLDFCQMGKIKGSDLARLYFSFGEGFTQAIKGSVKEILDGDDASDLPRC